jgi:dihydrofolate synthase/folylpolyglutamate synthase
VTWPEALDYLFGLEQRGIKLDLARMRDCLEDLGRPQDAFRSILVAGTNGKGSTSAALASVLARPGRHVGLYTSPHLLDYRERIRLDGRLAPAEALLAGIERDHVVWERHALSFFEATTALAFSFFRDAGVEIAVCEVGLGGRLDATNTVEPILSVITPLGMDHAQILGPTADAIAREKAGILRPGVPAAVSSGPHGALDAVRARAAELGAPLYQRRACVRVEDIHAGAAGNRFLLRPRAGSPAGFSLPQAGLRCEITLPGIHQVGNAALAVLSLALLRERGIPIRDAEIESGLARLRWPGRLERPVAGLPMLADVAHNPEGARVLARFLASEARRREIRPVVGMLETKDHAGFFHAVRRFACEAWIAPLGIPRAATRERLEEAAGGAGLGVRGFASVCEALEDALSGAREPDGPLVLLCGSFHALDEGYRSLGVPACTELWRTERPH